MKDLPEESWKELSELMVTWRTVSFLVFVVKNWLRFLDGDVMALPVLSFVPLQSICLQNSFQHWGQVKCWKHTNLPYTELDSWFIKIVLSYSVWQWISRVSGSGLSFHLLTGSFNWKCWGFPILCAKQRLFPLNHITFPQSFWFMRPEYMQSICCVHFFVLAMRISNFFKKVGR